MKMIRVSSLVEHGGGIICVWHWRFNKGPWREPTKCVCQPAGLCQEVWSILVGRVECKPADKDHKIVRVDACRDRQSDKKGLEWQKSKEKKHEANMNK